MAFRSIGPENREQKEFYNHFIEESICLKK